jgi:hypothetical protein
MMFDPRIPQTSLGPFCLSPVDRQLFWDIWLSLLAFVNDEKRVVPDFGHPKSSLEAEGNDMFAIEQAMWVDDEVIERYIKKHGNIPKLWVKIARSWKQHRVDSAFVVMRQFKDFTVLFDEKNDCLWGVTGIFFPLIHFCRFAPCFAETTLLPFKDKMIYDSMLRTAPVKITGNMRRELIEHYHELLERDGIRRSSDDSINNLPKAWINDDDDITAEYIEGVDDDANYEPLAYPPEMEAKIEAFHKDHPDATIDETNAMLKQLTDEENSKALDRFDGLSPNQMMNLEYKKFGDNGITVKNEKAGEDTPFIKQAAYFLELIKDAGQVTLTQANYLPTKIVRDLYEKNICINKHHAEYFEWLRKKGKRIVYSERDFHEITTTRVLCNIAGFTKTRNNKLSLTKKGVAALEMRNLFKPIFTAFCDEYNWAYWEYDEYNTDYSHIGQWFYGWTFYLLNKYGDKKRPTTFYSDKYRSVAFPVFKDTKADRFFDLYFRNRTFYNFLALFNFVEVTEDKEDYTRYVQTTPLFNECVSINIPNHFEREVCREK